MVKNTDINDFLKMKMNGNTSIGSTPKLLGTFIDSIYCYFTLEYANLKAIIYYIEKIDNKDSIDKAIISERVNDDMTKFLMTYFSNMRIPFTMTSDFDTENKAALLIITRKDIQRDPLLYTPEVPIEYLECYGKALCKKCYDELFKIDPAITKHYKKLPFFLSGECPICNKEES